MSVYACCLLAVIVAGPLPESASQAGAPAADFDPGLVDVNGLDVVVTVRRHPTRDPNVSGVTSRLERLVGSKLKDAGIPVTEQTLDQIKAATGAGGPVLRIAVDLLSLGDEPPGVLYAQTSLVRLVHLHGRSGQPVKATVWNADPVLKSVPPSQWQNESEAVILEQVESFVAARKAAASHDGEAPVVLDASASPRNAAAALQSPFVASRNSSVFHRADCPMARNISAGNLVGYNSRDEAIQDGKRPCKSCQP
jgi:hypothetical protein